ncbi:MAG: hypothetical protein J6T35_02710 [Bacteroidales bacterium]|nr:hypothetical protein [Bacteroidales bacterium]
MMKKILFMMMAFVLMGACKQGVEVPYTQMQHYFFKNGAVIPEEAKISDAARFERLFGAAAVMGENGLPTSVDFAKEFVIAVVCPATDLTTELQAESLRQENGTLVFTYRKTVGGRQTWSMQPVLLIKVDKQYETLTVKLIQNE